MTDILDREVELRWRLADKKLPMRERHLKSLKSYGLDGPIQSWLRTRLEYVLDNHAATNPDGCIHITITTEGKALFEVGPRMDEPVVSADSFVMEEGRVSGVRIYESEGLLPVPLWVADAEAQRLVVGADQLVSATCTTLRDLATTKGWSVDLRPVSADEAAVAGDAFVVTDEFGVLPVQNGAASQLFAELMGRLWK